MKTETRKYVTAFSLLTLLAACAPMQPLTSAQDMETRFTAQNSKGDYSHAALVRRHENFASEMLAKAQEQKAILKNKPSTSFFGRNGQHVKPRIYRKIHSYEQAAKESFAKAAYHRKIANEQTGNFAKPEEPHKKMDKARFRLNNSSSPEASESYNESL